jgi:hypothetical protein
MAAVREEVSIVLWLVKVGDILKQEEETKKAADG